MVTHSGVIARGWLSNVSISGAFIETPLPVPLLSHLRVQFNSALDGRPTLVEGQVVRRDANGIGIEWRELAPEALAALVQRPTTLHEERRLLTL